MERRSATPEEHALDLDAPPSLGRPGAHLRAGAESRAAETSSMRPDSRPALRVISWNVARRSSRLAEQAAALASPPARRGGAYRRSPTRRFPSGGHCWGASGFPTSEHLWTPPTLPGRRLSRRPGRVGGVQRCSDVGKPDAPQHCPPEGKRRVGDLLERHHIGLATRQCRGLLCQSRRAAGDIPANHPQRGTRVWTHRRSLRGPRLRPRAEMCAGRPRLGGASRSSACSSGVADRRSICYPLSLVQPSPLDGGRGHLRQIDEAVPSSPSERSRPACRRVGWRRARCRRAPSAMQQAIPGGTDGPAPGAELRLFQPVARRPASPSPPTCGGNR